MPRYFRIEQAEQLLPEIETAVRQAASLKKFLDEADGELRATAERITLLGGAQIDREKLLARRARRDALESRLAEHVTALQEHGCLVKDLELGLVDFPTLLRGQEVLLCWKLGEVRIEFWHGLEEGFRGRKPVDQEFLDHHAGDH